MKKIVLLLILGFSTVVFAAKPVVAVPEGAKVQPENLFPKVAIETSLGTLVVELNRHRAPITVNNFLRYVVEKHYDGTLIHRVEPEFVIQGGGYDAKFQERPLHAPIFNESGNGLKNDMGTIAMARYSDPHSATDQFYFNLNDNDSLNPGRRWGYAVFGEVVEGEAVLEKIAAVKTGYSEQLDAENVPLQPVVIRKIRVLPED